MERNTRRSSAKENSRGSTRSHLHRGGEDRTQEGEKLRKTSLAFFIEELEEKDKAQQQTRTRARAALQAQGEANIITVSTRLRTEHNLDQNQLDEQARQKEEALAFGDYESVEWLEYPAEPLPAKDEDISSDDRDSFVPRPRNWPS